MWLKRSRAADASKAKKSNRYFGYLNSVQEIADNQKCVCVYYLLMTIHTLSLTSLLGTFWIELMEYNRMKKHSLLSTCRVQDQRPLPFCYT